MINNLIKPFAIVAAPYVDLEGQIKVFPTGETQRGLFLVLKVDDNDNVLAVKITSQNKYISEFCYTLRKANHPFLMCDSNVQFDKWHTLALSSCTFLGYVDYNLRFPLLRRLDSITRAIDSTLKDNIVIQPASLSYTSSYVSPNKRSSHDKNRSY
jgi:hypothetical protein